MFNSLVVPLLMLCSFVVYERLTKKKIKFYALTVHLLHS